MQHRGRIIFALGAATLVVGSWVVSSRIATVSAQDVVSDHNATRADFDRYMKELSNWGRWGKDDQMGAVNLITPARRKQALSSVKDGISVSMARNAETESAIDNSRPIIRQMSVSQGGPPKGDIGGAADTFTTTWRLSAAMELKTSTRPV